MLEAKRQKSGPFSIGKISEAANAHETLRKQVQHKATQELFCLECLELFPVAMGTVPPAKGDQAIRKRNQAVIGNGHAMGIAAEIAERTCSGPLKGRLQ